MSMMAVVTENNVARVAKNFPPFQPQPGDRYLDIRTMLASDPIIHCICTNCERTYQELKAPPGFYVYVDDDKGVLWYHSIIDTDEVDELLSYLNLTVARNVNRMTQLGFIPIGSELTA